ncbi:unnamed protein product [Prunus armeniaca]|uniref:Pentatricopeptide repeat-containing protein n=1 Tax=Prunus armeniaca TaxID=36596 RepID=A0A6J5WEF9_PRUAR|nr:unnamed protein product [Prunus armeniaca]
MESKEVLGAQERRKESHPMPLCIILLTGVFCISNQVEEAEGLFAEMKSKGTAACHLQYSNGCTQQKVVA